MSEVLLSASEELGRILRVYRNQGRPAPKPSQAEEGEWVIYPREQAETLPKAQVGRRGGGTKRS